VQTKTTSPYNEVVRDDCCRIVHMRHGVHQHYYRFYYLRVIFQPYYTASYTSQLNPHISAANSTDVTTPSH